MAEIPGITAKHAFVTDTCRRNHTDAGAVDEALARLRDEAMAILGGWPEGRGAKLHFALTMERPDVRNFLDDHVEAPLKRLDRELRDLFTEISSTIMSRLH